MYIFLSTSYHVVFEEANEPLLATFEQKIANGEATPADMGATVGKTLQLITSITFGGPDLKTVYIGSLGMASLPTFQSPIAGLPMNHWK